MAGLVKGAGMFTVDIEQNDLYTALRGFILSVIPGIEVIQGLGNGVPMPQGGFIAMTALSRTSLSTNHHDYTETQYKISQHQQYSMQIDCYGRQASDWASLLTSLLRDEYACSIFPHNIQPLYCDDARQMAVVNAEQQYEQRWMITAYFQFNQTWSRPNGNN